MNTTNKTTGPYSILIRISAFLLPVYFVFYPPLHEQPERKSSKILWLYVFAGFAMYILIAGIIILFT